MDLSHVPALSVGTIEGSEPPLSDLPKDEGNREESYYELPAEEDIINIALQHLPEDRHRLMPERFDLKGQARSRRLDARRLIREKNSSLSTKLNGTQQKSQKGREAVALSIIVENNSPSANEHTPPGCQQCSSANRRCNLWGSHVAIGQACGKCMRKGELCSLSTLAGDLHHTLRRGTKRKQPTRRSTQRAKDIRKVTQTALLESNSSTQQEIAQPDVGAKDTGRNQEREDRTDTLPDSTTTLGPNQDERETTEHVASSHNEIHDHVESLCETGHTPAFNKLNAERQQDCINTISFMHRCVPHQGSNDSASCPNCGCVCARSPQPAEEIFCNGTPCSRNWFGSEYLEKYCGITLLDARKSHEQFGFWHCPECSERGKRLSGDFLDTAALNLPSRFGHQLLSDEDVQRASKRFSGYILRYLHTANTNTLESNIFTPFVQIPCIRDETLDQPANRLIDVLRGMLGTQPGVLMKDKIVSLHLQDVKTSTWVEGILSFLLGEFIFKTPSPFEDFSLPKRVLSKIFSPEVTEVITQDIRVQTTRENSTRFSECLKARLDMQVKQLNAAMTPLVGSNDRLHSLHTMIAKIAEELNKKFNTYTGTFALIRPLAGDEFDPNLHTTKTVGNERENMSSRRIQFATVMGVRFRLPGYRDWRVCAKAEVQLYPV